MTSGSAGLHESASTRALGMYDIVALIASYSPVWQSCSQLKSGWENSGLQARGVCRLWKEAFDARICTSTISGDHLAFASDDYEYLPHPTMKILAGSDGECLRKVRHLHAMYYAAASCNQRCIAIVMASTAPRLTYLGTDMMTLAALAEARPYPSKVAFGKLEILRLVLFYEDYAADGVNVMTVQKISDLLATMSSLTAADIYVEEDFGQDKGTLGWQALHMLFSVHLTISSVTAILSTSLAAVLAHFKPKKLRLELRPSKGHIDLWDVLPPTISIVEYSSPGASISAFLEIFSDPRQLPMLLKIPMIEITSNADASPDDDEKQSVTQEIVAEAIVGMQDRGIEVDAMQAAELYKLVNA